MNTKTKMIGLLGLALGIAAFSGKAIDMTGSNELLVLGAGLIVLGFLLPITIQSNRTADNQMQQITWLGFMGLTAVALGLTLMLLKYWMVAKVLLVTGGIFTSLYFALVTAKVRNLSK